MREWKKIPLLILVLTLALFMVSCSTVQSIIGSVTGNEDPSVAGNKPAGNKPAGDHSGDTAADPGQSGQGQSAINPIIDESVQPIELYGVQIPRYTNYASIVDFGNVRSDISTISVLDATGNERILFNSGKPIKDYIATLANEFIADQPEPVYPTNTYSCALDGHGGRCNAYNWTDVEMSAWDLECTCIQNINPKEGTNLSITDLGKPTAIYVDWTDNSTGQIICRGVYMYWKCNGFYIEGHAYGIPEADGNGGYRMDDYNLALYDLSRGIKANGATAHHSLVALELGWDDVVT